MPDDIASATTPAMSEAEAVLIELFELTDDGPYDPCPDCGNDPADSTLHAEGCRRIRRDPLGDLTLQFGPPWKPWPAAVGPPVAPMSPPRCPVCSVVGGLAMNACAHSTTAANGDSRSSGDS